MTADDEPAEGEPPPRVLTVAERRLAELVYAARTDAQMARTLRCGEADVRAQLVALAFTLPGPGTARARIVRYVRGERDAALAQLARDLPLPWLVDLGRRAA